MMPTATRELPAMITIEITNLDELVKEHRGPLSALFGKLVTNVEGEVERIIMNELKEEFEKRGIKANMTSIGGINIRRHFSV
jgi:fructose-1,6-bisphosphatase/inositol monophosphatase family enzyme